MKLSVYYACFALACGLIVTATPVRAQTIDATIVSQAALFPASGGDALQRTPELPQKTIRLTQPIVLERIPHHYRTRFEARSCAVTSDELGGKKSRLGIGVFFPTGSTGLKSDTGFGLIYEYLAKSGRSGDLVLTIGLNYYHSGGTVGGTDISADILLIPVLVEYQFHIGKHFYAGPALGYNSVTATVSGGGDSVNGSGSSLAYGITLGYQQKSLFAETRYLGSDKSGDAGMMFLIGGRF